MDWVARSQGPVGLSILAFCAFIEYVFPPFPGDLIVVFGAFLATRRGWSPVGVMAAVLAGSAAGTLVGYFVGRRLHRAEEHGRFARVRDKLDSLIERFRRHGALYIAINRFLPSVRALFFVAAGMAELPVWQVLAFGLLSAAAWNLVLFALGATVGSQWSRLERIVMTYGEIAWVVLAVAALIVLGRWLWRRRRSVNGR